MLSACHAGRVPVYHFPAIQEKELLSNAVIGGTWVANKPELASAESEILIIFL